MRQSKDRSVNLNKGMKRLIIILIILVIIGFLAIKVFKVQKIVLRKMYKIDYLEHVEKYAKEYEVDPKMIFAIIKAESNFNPNVVSKSGAIGLMQLMDTTAEELCNKMDIFYVKKTSLYQPELNIQLGTKYFSSLLQEYDNNYLLALTAYNAGIGNVKKWIEQGVIQADGSDIENIPFKETNNYVRKIVRDYKIYQDLYKEGFTR